jgi:murein DD-endopeptidase MepM/ murein hydrolase activator NlpD
LPRGYDGPYGRDSYRGPGGYERLSGPYGGPAPVIPLNEGQEKHAIGEKDFIGRPSDPVAGDRGNGKVVTLRHGETIEDLADRYGVSPELIAKANNLNGSYPRPGQDLLIPVPGGVSFVNVSPGIIKPTKEVCEKGGCYTVKSGDTPLSIAKAHNIQVKALLEMNGIKEARELKAGRTIVIPGVVAAPAPQPVAAPVQQPREVPGKATIAAKEERPAQAVERQQAPAERKVAEAPVPVDIPAPVQEQAKPMQAAIQDGDGNCEASLLNPLPRTGQNFRMPVEGRVITSFGKQKDNSVSEGIAISVPKGTPIKASENGVVAYVGNELAGFGNLILIKHADDYVTAYANADEVLVKRCQVVKRGETIAKAGTSGGVPQPQVHFEIRKGAKPVDPQTLASS